MTLRVLLVALCLPLAGACAKSRHLAPGFGDAHRDAFAAQVAHPEAGYGPAEEPALPGEVADEIYRERYRKSLVEETEQRNGASVASELRELR